MTKTTMLPSKPKMLIDEISDATTEAIYPIAQTIAVSEIGNIFIKIREFGLFFTRADNFQNRLIGRLCEYYDGIVTGKQTKNENTEKNIENIAVTALMYTDYSAFGNQIHKNFDLLMQTGFARRCMLSFNKKEKSDCKIFTKQEKLQYYNKLDVIGERLFKTFTYLTSNSVLEISDDAFSVFNDYYIILNDLCNEEEDSIIKKEIKSRHLKAIKLAGLYAILQHPTELLITEDDAFKAIVNIEFMSKDFKKFINFIPTEKDDYDNIFRWFKDHEDEEFSKTDLTKRYYKEFGYTRLSFSDRFDSIILGVKRLAEVNDYIFNIQDVKPVGTKYSLIRPKEKPLSSNVSEFESILYNSSVEDSDKSDNATFAPF